MDLLTSLDFWLWAAALMAALLYLLAAYWKLFWPIDRLAGMMRWPGDVSPGFVRAIGLVDLAAALGLVLPLATGILIVLTPLAALGSVVLQVLAIGFHGRRGETRQTVGLNLLLLLLGAFVLWGRRGLLGL